MGHYQQNDLLNPQIARELWQIIEIKGIQVSTSIGVYQQNVS